MLLTGNLSDMSQGHSYVLEYISRSIKKTVREGIQSGNGLGLAPQIAQVQVKVKGGLLGLAVQFLVVPGGTKWVSSSQLVPPHFQPLASYVGYIPFLLTAYRYLKPK